MTPPTDAIFQVSDPSSLDALNAAPSHGATESCARSAIDVAAPMSTSTPPPTSIPIVMDPPTKPVLDFTIDVADLRRVARITRLKTRQAPRVFIAVESAEVHCTTATQEGRLTVTSTAALYDFEAARKFQFDIDSDVFARIATVFEGLLIFTFDPDEKALRWRSQHSLGRYSVPAKPAEPRTIATMSHPVATLAADTLRDAVTHAALFTSGLKRSRGPYDGLRIGEGAATSGYGHALTKYASALIPNGAAIILPVTQAGNVKTILAKLSGPIDIAIDEATVCLRASDTVITWTKEGRWPAEMDRAFQLPVKSSFGLPTRDLQHAALVLSIATDMAALKIEQRDDLGRLILAGHSISKRSHTPLSPWSPLTELPADTWTFAIKVKDLLTAALAISTDHVRLEVTDRGLYLRSQAPAYESSTFLLGSQIA